MKPLSYQCFSSHAASLFLLVRCTPITYTGRPRTNFLTTYPDPWVDRIQETAEDVIIPGVDEKPPTLAGLGYKIDNWLLLGKDTQTHMRSGGSLKRETRYSLTCRDVERVTSGKSLLGRQAQY